MKPLAAVFAAALLVAPAGAQAQSDPRWAPWLGCWELAGENVREASDPTAASGLGATAPARRGDEATPRVCATPADGGVTFTTTIGGDTALTQSVFPDGIDRPVDESGCRGTQRAEWSADGLRVFSTARLTCANDPAPRRVSALSLLGRNGQWIDVQAVEIGGREDVRVRRYRRADAASPSAVPSLAATRLTVDDIKEASTKIAPRALEAALIEVGAGFDLDGRTLLDLDDAGVAGSVVDVMVALSYPDRFIVERARDRGARGTIFLSEPYGIDYGFYSPLYGSLYYPFYYSPFAYSYYGRFDPRFFGGGGVLIPVAPGGTDGPPDPPASGRARAVDGLGYTRVRPRGDDEATTARPGRRVAPAAATAGGDGGSSGAGSAPAASGPSSGSSGGGAVTSGGFSSGSGSETGRTAVPR